jgi:hypothetical protein
LANWRRDGSSWAGVLSGGRPRTAAPVSTADRRSPRCRGVRSGCRLSRTCSGQTKSSTGGRSVTRQG